METCWTLKPMAPPSGKQRTMPSVQLTLNSLEINVFFSWQLSAMDLQTGRKSSYIQNHLFNETTVAVT